MKMLANFKYSVLMLAAQLLLSLVATSADIKNDVVKLANAHAALTKKKITVEMQMTMNDRQKHKFNGTVESGDGYHYVDFMNTLTIRNQSESLSINKLNNVITYNAGPNVTGGQNPSEIIMTDELLKDAAWEAFEFISDNSGIRSVRIKQPANSEYKQVVVRYSLATFLLQSVEYTYAYPENSGVEFIRISYSYTDVTKADPSKKWKMSTYITRSAKGWHTTPEYAAYRFIDLTSINTRP